MSPLARNRKFESISLQRRVTSEPLIAIAKKWILRCLGEQPAKCLVGLGADAAVVPVAAKFAARLRAPGDDANALGRAFWEPGDPALISLPRPAWLGAA